MILVLKFIIAAIVVWVVLIAALKGMALLLRKQTTRAALAALQNEAILKQTDNASYLGAHFPGPNLPPRTSGFLALTESRLFFLPWFPRRSITLPRPSISSVESVPSFGNNSFNIPVLVITVRGVGDPDGEMGWLVHDAEGWEREIKKVVGSQETGIRSW
jgi:hypothetical protein